MNYILRLQQINDLIKTDLKKSKVFFYEMTRAALNKEFSVENYINILENLHTVNFYLNLGKHWFFEFCSC